MTTRVVFPVIGTAVSGKVFSLNRTNPGVGGTQFVTIMLAMALAWERRDYEIWLWSQVPLELEDAPENLKQVLVECAPFPESELFVSQETLFVSPNAVLRKLNFSQTKVCCKLINWLHHPFNAPARGDRLRYSAHVSVGIYQYYSNMVWYRSHWHIPNLFNAQLSNLSALPSWPTSETLRLVFLGALIPGKGFHHVIAAWPKIRKHFANARLDVVGSTETYTGKKPEHTQIPTTAAYAEKISKFLPEEDLQTKRVVFHGNLGVEKLPLLEKAHLAVLNPTGATEAFPGAPLECLMCGTPVIASNDFGMSDVMRYFPELSLSQPDEILAKLIWVADNRLRYQELQSRALSVAEWYSGQRSQTLLRWQQLIDVVAGSDVVESRAPAQSFHGNRLELVARIAKRTLRKPKR